MSTTGKLMQAYFNHVYNPVYDFTTGRFSRYQHLQKRCVSKLEFKDNDVILCAGLGTGNEIYHILRTNRNVKIVGVDFSKRALKKASKKALMYGKEIKVLLMDIRHLEFAAGSFDKVLCLHVMDFVSNREEATGEILRVLKDGGQFVITYPSDREGIRLGLNLLKGDINHNVNSGKNRIRSTLRSLAQMLVGIVYLPLLFRPKQKSYSRSELEVMISKLTTRGFRIANDKIYQDFIVYGAK